MFERSTYIEISYTKKFGSVSEATFMMFDNSLLSTNIDTRLAQMVAEDLRVKSSLKISQAQFRILLV